MQNSISLFRRFNTPLRGRSIHVIMDEIVESLISLEMIDPELATVFDTVRFAPTNCGFVTFKELQERALKALIK